MSLLLIIRGEPVAKQRARVTVNGSYTPKETVAYTALVALQAKAQMRKVKAEKMEGPLAMRMDFYLPRPMKPKWDVPAVRPDADNYAKCVMDALNGIAFVDDGQIVRMVVQKHYAPSPENVRAEIHLEGYGL